MRNHAGRWTNKTADVGEHWHENCLCNASPRLKATAFAPHFVGSVVVDFNVFLGSPLVSEEKCASGRSRVGGGLMSAQRSCEALCVICCRLMQLIKGITARKVRLFSAHSRGCCLPNSARRTCVFFFFTQPYTLDLEKSHAHKALTYKHSSAIKHES